MLLWPGTALDKLWTLNPAAHSEIARLGQLMGVPFYALSITLMITAVGWFKQRIWGWRLAIVIIASQVIGNAFNFVRGDFLRASAGLVIAGALLIFLLRSKIRAVFR